MSSRATSGCRARAAATTSSPRPTWATTSKSSSSSSSAASAERTSAWSSASSSPDRHAGIVGSVAPFAVCPGRLVRQPRRAVASRRLRPAATSVPPAACTRSRSPVSPLPAPAIPPRPSSSISIQRRAERDRAVAGPGVAHHVGDAFAHDPAEQLVQPRVDDVDRTGQLGLRLRPPAAPRGRSPARRPASRRGSRHGGADVGQRAAASAARPRRSPGGPLRVALGQPSGEAGLDRDRGQRVAEQVVQVAGDAGALVLGGQPGDLGAGRGELDVRPDDREERRTSRRRRAGR